MNVSFEMIDRIEMSRFPAGHLLSANVRFYRALPELLVIRDHPPGGFPRYFYVTLRSLPDIVADLQQDAVQFDYPERNGTDKG